SSHQSGLLNLVMGGLLGGTLDLNAVGWNGLLNTQINLLDYLVALGANAGDYESLLNSQVSLAELLEAAVKVMERQGAAAQAAVTALESLQLVAGLDSLKIRLGDLLGVASGTPAAGL